MKDGEKVLVTGGAGFIGSHLVKKMLNISAKVAVIDNLSFGRKEHLPLGDKNISFYDADIRKRDVVMQIFQDFSPDIVCHLAALHFIPYCNKHPVEVAEVNLMGTRNILAACSQVKPSSLFFASSAAVYPIQEGRNTENSRLGPTDIYGITKVAGENLVELFHYRTGTRTIVGRLFNVYGPNETNPHVIPEIIEQLNSGKRALELGNLAPKRDFIHVSDVVEAIITLLNNSEAGFDIFNIGSGKEYSVKQLVGYLEEILNKKIRVEKDRSRVRESERMNLLADISKIQVKIGWSPQVDIKKGLVELVT